MTDDGKWRFWIDRGGTFTDVIARAPDGALETRKYLSDNPTAYADAAVAAMRDVLGAEADAPFPADKVAEVRMGTTVATNALLERDGERVLLVTTKGFADALAIGTQNRPKLFDLNIRKPAPLYEQVIEIDERVDARGNILRAPDQTGVRRALEEAHRAGFRAAAVLFMHGYRFPDHENMVAALARDVGFSEVSTSHGAAEMMKFIARGDTAVADAYLSPKLRRYVDGIAKETGLRDLYFMQSNGGLARADHFRGKDAILSGPAGGIVGAAETAVAAGFRRIVTFDMGGTSTDVSHYAGEFERTLESEIAGTRLQVPMMDIHTVAAGGGSVCAYRDGRFRVGPASAGANPGPACYGRGGPLTVTDCNLVAGRLLPDYFPRVFGPDGDQPLDEVAARARIDDVITSISNETGEALSREDVAEGFLRVANQHMARAIKRVSVERGHDITRHALVSFGGAGGQHATAVADALGVETVLIHPMAGVLSALGMGLAQVREMRLKTLEVLLEDTAMAGVAAALDGLETEAREALKKQGVEAKAITADRQLHVKYQGSDTALSVPATNGGAGATDEIRSSFEAAHKSHFGFTQPGRPISVETASVEAAGTGANETANFDAEASGRHEPAAISRIFSGGVWRDAPVYRRQDLTLDQAINGPVIIVEDHGTNVIAPGWQAGLRRDGMLVLTRATPRMRVDAATAVDPVMLEVFNNLFMGAAEEMGAVLANTAHSVNMKERLDFSCAVFDADGNLVANAPHMPVHLGSMGESVAEIIRRNEGDIGPGDCWMLNDPDRGGTHLPDVTVVTPVFLVGEGRDGDDRPRFFVASRGHHADIGGISPGSMPPNSSNLVEEGVVFDNFLLVRDGLFREKEVREALANAPYPARNPDQNIADLKAEVAANARGVELVKKLVADFGPDVVSAYMRHVRTNAEEAVRRVIDALLDSGITYKMDGGRQIRVSIRVDKPTRAATIDFTGTSPEDNGNLNAPRAITKAAVLYAFRALVDDDIPLNAGCLAPLTIILPEGSLLSPSPGRAVVAGNVETSQAVTNALLLATGALAASQGTMNNLTFGDDQTQYYETIAGGAGAGDGFDGADAVQVHMTNSRLTDPEVLEWRTPVLIEEFSVRKGSGGAGTWRGGNGAVRKIRFLRDMSAAILSSHREVPPPGLTGGAPGMRGRNAIERADGTIEELNGADCAELKVGDAIIIETPGGGGYGDGYGDDGS